MITVQRVMRAVAVLILLNGLVQAATINVPGDFGTIQGAIADPGTVYGDEIVVQPGTYFEVINFLGKAITLRSASGDPNNTIIDGLELYHVVQCVNNEDPNTVLAGFTITGGNADGTSPDDVGAGMYNFESSPTVTNCIFTGNHAKGSGGLNKGGGMYNDQGNPIVTDCTFKLNSAEGFGGGMHNLGKVDSLSSPVVTDCTFELNSAEEGGGMYNENSSPTVINCTFTGNSATKFGGGMKNFIGYPIVTNCTFSGNSANEGGGACNILSYPTFTDCTFSGNTANLNGGGMYNGVLDLTIIRCTFTGNIADLDGGGMFNYYHCNPTVAQCRFIDNTAINGGGMGNKAGSSPIVTNSIFSRNLALDGDGAGMSNVLGCNPVVADCTFSDNEIVDRTEGGGGMSNTYYSSPTVTNTIFWGNLPEQVSYHDPNSIRKISFSLVQGGSTGIGNKDEDPLFVDASTDDLHLQAANSPAVDTGSNALVVGRLDLDGNKRVVDVPGVGLRPGDIVDMGAYEFGSWPCPCANGLVGDVNCDRIVNLVDLGLIALHWLETI